MTRRSDFDRRQAVARLYDEACAAIDKERWQEAVEKLDRVRDIDLNFPGAEWRQQQAHKWYRIAKLHEMGQQHMRTERWHDALSCFRHIRQEAGEYKNVALLQRICERQLIPPPPPDNRRQLVLATSAVAAGFALATLGLQGTTFFPVLTPPVALEVATPTATQDVSPTMVPPEVSAVAFVPSGQTDTPTPSATVVPVDNTPLPGATSEPTAIPGGNPPLLGPTSTRRPTSTTRPPTHTPTRIAAPPASTRPPPPTSAPPGSTTVPTMEFTPDATAASTVPATATSLAPTPTPVATVGVALVTDTPTPAPGYTNTPQPTPLPPTPTSTATQVLPTPTDSATPVPPPPTPSRTATPLPPPATRTPTPVPTPGALFVIAKEYDFLPAGMQVQAGARVRLTLSNQGTQAHSWVLRDGAGNTLAKLTASPGQNGVLDFSAPAAGVYSFICDVADHAQLGMKGQLTVR